MNDEILQKRIENTQPNERARWAAESLGEHCQKLDDHGFAIDEIQAALFSVMVNSMINRDGQEIAVQWLRDTADGIESTGPSKPKH